MLSHQLPSLPPYETFWDELPAFFDWLAGGEAPVVPTAYAIATGETVLRERELRLPVSGSTQAMIEVIRFAAANRLLVELNYQGSTRRIEPYSLRRTSEGNIVLHAFNADKNEHRSYRIDRMNGASITNQSFVPRYEIELTPLGPVRVVPSAARMSSPVRGTRFPAHRASTGRMPSFGGVVYTYQCPVCSKKFKRSTMDAHLNPHKNPSGYACSGRHGILVGTGY
jgi:hypothetical protein